MNDIQRPSGIRAIDAEMALQHADARATHHACREKAAGIAQALRSTKRLVMLGMGASHAVARAVEPLYRQMGIAAVSLPLSEQLGQPLPLAGHTVLVTSQSGESGEVVRWLDEANLSDVQLFGLTLDAGSTLARRAPSLIGCGGAEIAFAGTRSLTVTLAMHMAILEALGSDVSDAARVLETPATADVRKLVDAFGNVDAIVTSGRSLQGVAEAVALGLMELSRLPCFALEGGQLRHGPLEMLGPKVGVVLFKADDHTAALVDGMAETAASAGSPVIVFDASAKPFNPEGGTVLATGARSGLAAIFALLPLAQAFMVEYALSRVSDAGTPIRSTKITRSA